MVESPSDTTGTGAAPEGADLSLRIESSTMKDLVYEKLRTAIVTGMLRPDQRLIELKVAAMLNVSRTPLREAILMLERERLLERLPHGGVRVPPVSLEEIAELNDIRAVLEGLAARRAAERVRDEPELAEASPDLEVMDAAIADMRTRAAGQEVLVLLRLGGEFHQAIHRLSGNQRCMDMAAQVIRAIERYRAFVPDERHIATIEEHERIANAIRNGMPDEAERSMRRHIEDAGELYKATIQKMQRT